MATVINLTKKTTGSPRISLRLKERCSVADPVENAVLIVNGRAIEIDENAMSPALVRALPVGYATVGAEAWKPFICRAILEGKL